MRSTRWLLAGCAVLAVLGCAVAIVVLVVVSRTASGPSGDAAAANDRGVGLMGQFEFDKAEQSFAQAKAHAPDWWVPAFNQAVATLNMTSDGAQARAIALLEPLARSGPLGAGTPGAGAPEAGAPEAETPGVKPRAEYCMGLAQLFLGEPAKAKPLFEAAFAAAPNDAHAAFYCAQCAELLGDHAAARALYERAIALNPMLRSSYLGVQRCADRLGDPAAAADALKRFQALGDDLRSTLAEFKYTRMGALSEALVEDPTQRHAASAGVGPAGAASYFGAPRELAVQDLPPDRISRNSVPSTVDINGDGVQDLVWPRAVCLGGSDGTWRFDPSHPLSNAPMARYLWADLNNDGMVDAIGVDSSGVAWALIQMPNDPWVQQKLPWPAFPTGEHAELFPCALVDLDHDGDADVACTLGGVPVLLMNRGDGTFEPRQLTAAADVGDMLVRCIVPADLDGDGDVDLVLLGTSSGETGHIGWRAQIWCESGLWNWSRERVREPRSDVAMVAAMPASRGQGPRLACISDSRASGRLDALEIWEPAPAGSRLLSTTKVSEPESVYVTDVSGSGSPEVIVFSGSEGNPAAQIFTDECVLAASCMAPDGRSRGLVPLVLDASGVQLVGSASGSGASSLEVWPAGKERYPCAVVNFRGRLDPSQQMRSNASGIGTGYAARAGSQWVMGAWLPAASLATGLQQSLEPVVIGLGPSGRASFISIRWPDGVLQTELDLKPGLRTIVETQRQISSCPVIFAWNGATHAFVTDCLGVGGMGYLASAERQPNGTIKPVYAPPRPWERVLLGDAGALALRDGAYEIRLGEPMEEACYLDAARLVAYDLPAGWHLALDERMGINGPQPTGEPLTYRDAVAPAKATVASAAPAPARDVTQALSARDGTAAELGPTDPRFIGRLADEAVLQVEFPLAMTDGSARLSHAGAPTLLVDGWVEYPYCQTNFAMWQAGAAYDAPTLEALDPATGRWILLVAQYGYPAGMPRQACFPIPAEKLPAHCTTLRLRTTMEIYFDRVQLAWRESCPQMARAQAPLESAECAFAGFPQRISHPQRRPDYDYARRAPLWDCRMQYGRYTAYGPCTELLASTDDAVAIFGAGEEVRLRFAPPPPVVAGWTRQWVLEVDGWCKDMDRYTGQGAHIEPLPSREGVGASLSGAARRHALHAKFNTRVGGGQ